MFCVLSPLCMATIGGVMFLFYPSLQNDWAAWIGYGFILYAFAMALFGSMAFLRYRKEGIAAAERDSLLAR